jgi:soluble lytic murein transglycosylase-like protein
LQSPGRTLDGPTRTQERPIQANSASANELTRPVAPRRPFLVALAGTAMLAAVEFTPPRAVETPSLSAVIAAGAPAQASHILVRPTVAPVDSASLERDVVSRYSYRPLALLLGRRNRDPVTATRIARAILKESGRLQVAPSLLTGVLLTENPRLETTSVSSQGAIGLMQVMDFHAGTFDCESDDLLQVEANICHGARVFGRYLKRTGNVQRALLRYNGCVVSANTPNCHRYPAKVTQAARQVRRELLLYRAGFRSDSAQ